MFNTKRIQDSIYEATTLVEHKIDIYVDQLNSLMNKQEILLKAINEDRLVITKILEHLEKIEKQENKKGRK